MPLRDRYGRGGKLQLSIGDLFPFMAAMTEYLVRFLFLIVGHHGIQSREGFRELLDAGRMGLRNVRIGIQIVDRRRARKRCATLVDGLIHILGVVAHRFRDLLPLRLLGRRDLELGMKVGDVVLHRVVAFCV